MTISNLFRPLQVAHFLLQQHLRPGMTAIDATVGRGYDTLFLIQHVLPGGQVYGFDIQPEAIICAKQMLEQQGIKQNYALITDCHSRMKQHVAHPVDAIMFNLGYLPGSDHSVITKQTSTLKALQAAFDLLAVGGVITIMVYPGHAGGDMEAMAVQQLMSGLPQKQWQVSCYQVLNAHGGTPPVLISAYKALEART